MKILGIDPGYDRLGLAIIEKTVAGGAGKEVILYSDCLQTSAKDAISFRLLQIGQEVGRIIEEYRPDCLAIETLFITRNQKTAMRVAEARGIIMYEAFKRDLPVHEYSPMNIKSSITSDGKSDKTRMIKMIHMLVKLPPKKKMLDDEYDAIAVALTHSAQSR
jgi:crossover junction endodeoxyribonuclease RuvC